MKKNLILGILLLGGLLFLLFGAGRQEGQEIRTGLKSMILDVDTRGPEMKAMDIPLFFISNRGQVHKEAQFYARTSRYTLWLTRGGLVFDGVRKAEAEGDLAVKGLEDWQKEKDAGKHPASSAQASSESLEREVTRLMFIDSNSNPEMFPVELSQHQVNYMVGRDFSKWFTGLKTSEAVLYKNLYNYIDLKVYGIEKLVEYDWMVKPGGDPSHICFRYEDVKGTRIDDKGDLIIATDWGKITHRRPVGYQVIAGKTAPGNKEERVYIDVTFKKIGENTYGFEVGEYDRSRELVIDPVVVVYSTYLGGSGDDLGVGLAVDGSGCAYITAETYSTDFPVKGAYQNTFKGGSRDVFVTKFAASGSSLVYSTYLGGSGDEESEGIQVDSSGRAYITGFTSSTDFPTQNAFISTYRGGDYDGFVTVLSASGSSLAYSTYLGGSGTDQAYAIALDSSKNVYVTGGTSSTNFPVLNAYKSTYGGGAFDTFVTKIDAAGTGGYSTYLGGSGKDIGFGIAVQGSNAYLVGYTTSLDFPIDNEYQNSHAGGENDCFLTKLSSTGTSLVYSTYLGGSGDDSAWGIALDSSGSAYVTGDTFSTDFPIQGGYQYYHAGGGRDIFITKFSPIGTTLAYSTYLGGTESDAAAHIAVNSSGEILITGYTSSADFPLRRAYQTNYNGGMDAFVVMLPTVYYGELGFSTFLGGGSWDSGRKIALDSSGNIYVAGYTDSPDFPTKGAYQNVGKGGREAFLAKLSTVEFGTLCGAVDNCQLTWTTGGSANWVEEIFDNYYDNDAAVSGSATASQFSYLQTAVTGPGQLSFLWRTNFSGVILKFYVDGQEQGINNYSYWEQKTYSIPDGTHTLKWSYETTYGYGYLDKVEFTPQSILVLNRNQLTFGAIPGTVSEAQTFFINNTSPVAFNWTATASHSWVSCTPNSGTGNAEVSVTVNAASLLPGDYTASITVSAPGATNSPKVVSVALHVYSSGQSQPPFGSFDLPDSENVRSSVPFTGWALDDIGMQSVKIYRQSGNSLVYIGDAIFVEGARPDKELPGYPGNYKAGWGYMMLTNFLPNGGNGVFTISAIATDLEGHQVTLGSKTLTIDNANAVNPFGAIDTPAQGGTASGNNYRNWGWALTPLPNTIPIDGSTIGVWVDGVNLGHPVYNIYRSDVAGLFPGYTNSNGAAGYYELNTTVYTNGLHTIFWTAADNDGNSDGIGSRYFSILNTSSTPRSNTLQAQAGWEGDFTPDSFTPVGILNGYRKVLEPAQLEKIYPDEKGLITIEIKELERIEVHLGSDNILAGFMKVGTQSRPLPVGSTLDREKGIFYWQTGLAFVGKYHLVFVREDEAGNKIGRNIVVTIKPKF